MKIGVDPGHGGKDNGAVGRILGLKEKDVTLQVGVLLRDLFSTIGWEAILTRQEDNYVSLQDRIDVLNQAGVDIILSIHVNSSVHDEPEYLSTHVLGLGSEAENVAKTIQGQLVASTGWIDGGVRRNNFFILRKANSTALLVELGFISNKEQEKSLSKVSFRQRLSWGLFKGLLDYYLPENRNTLVSFHDVGGHWAEDDIKAVVQEGFMSGYADGSFRPDQVVTRCELAAAINRLLSRLPG